MDKLAVSAGIRGEMRQGTCSRGKKGSLFKISSRYTLISRFDWSSVEVRRKGKARMNLWNGWTTVIYRWEEDARQADH